MCFFLERFNRETTTDGGSFSLGEQATYSHTLLFMRFSTFPQRKYKELERNLCSSFVEKEVESA